MDFIIYALLILCLLTVTSWLDKPIKRFKLRQSYITMFCITCIALHGFNVSPLTEYEMRLSAIAFPFLILCAALYMRQFFLHTFSICLCMLSIAATSAVIIIPKLSIEVIIVPIALLLGIFMNSKPVLATCICTSVPFWTYILSILAEGLLSINTGVPSIEGVQNAQAIALLLSLFSAYVARVAEENFEKRKNTEGNI